MNRMEDLGLHVRTFSNGKLGFIAGLVDALGIPQLFNATYEEHKEAGCHVKIPLGSMAKLFLINICDNHHPLYRMQDYFEDKDLPQLAGAEVQLEDLTDDRFASLLDHLSDWGPRSIFSTIATRAFFQYGLSIRTLNYDTTSKVMWGEYQDEEGTAGHISITLGHSKDKRPDKNQLKVGLGTADGVICDAKVLSGNEDDKTYNNVTLDDVAALLEQHEVDRSGFYYVADAAFFTEDNLRKAQSYGMHFITRAPETLQVTKDLLQTAWEQPDAFRKTVFTNAQHAQTPYYVQEFSDEYRGIPGRFAVCYSPQLETQKRKTVMRRVEKERKELEDLARISKKRTFVCEEDAVKEIAMLQKKKLHKVRYHQIQLDVVAKELRGRGRPRKDETETSKRYAYFLAWTMEPDEERIEATIQREATFVLATNDLSLPAENMLEEYRTQNSVEKKFQQLKSPHFVNSLYLNKPERVEALVYLILTALMILSVAERVVRREMEAEKETVVGPGRITMKRPSLRAILGVFRYVPVNREIYQGRVTRYHIEPLTESQQKVLRYLRIPESVFTDGPSVWIETNTS